MSVQSSMTKVAEILSNDNISFCLIGGYAVSIWGAVRSTLDIDLLIMVNKTQQTALINLFNKEQYEVELRKSDIFDPIGDVLNSNILGIPVQLICSRYQWEEDMINRAVAIRISDDLELPVISVEDLIIMKLRGGSIIDFYDVNNLIDIRKSELDIEYLKKMIEKLKLKKTAVKTDLNELLKY
ncbi:MAG: nucleotidyltransferase [Clostridia bacterium]|nr:nucleotidyltransferase [Clostridia bacterium]